MLLSYIHLFSAQDESNKKSVLHQTEDSRKDKQTKKDDSASIGDNIINVKFNKCLTFFHYNKLHFVKCKACLQFPEIVKLHCSNNKPPPITTNAGTKFLEKIVKDHLISKVHLECFKAYQQSLLSLADLLEKTPIGRSLDHSTLVLANHIGKLMIHAYGSVKKLTLSANTFPARIMMNNMANKFNFNNNSEESEYNLNYVTPASFREFLEVIVQCHRPKLEQLFINSLALSLRCDGSIDKTQIDKIYTMVKTISKDGSDNLYFLGAAEPEERGAKGLLGAVQNGCRKTLGRNASSILKLISSIVTDGAAVNTGEKNGLWTLFYEFLKNICLAENEENSELKLPPLLKIWCAAHRY